MLLYISLLVFLNVFYFFSFAWAFLAVLVVRQIFFATMKYAYNLKALSPWD